ncbi:MAG: hypothetical protein ACP5SH_18815 [Syntrophobacteraceae bacterium]
MKKLEVFEGIPILEPAEFIKIAKTFQSDPDNPLLIAEKFPACIEPVLTHFFPQDDEVNSGNGIVCETFYQSW